jgi:hypothetical protein
MSEEDPDQVPDQAPDQVPDQAQLIAQYEDLSNVLQSSPDLVEEKNWHNLVIWLSMLLQVLRKESTTTQQVIDLQAHIQNLEKNQAIAVLTEIHWRLDKSQKNAFKRLAQSAILYNIAKNADEGQDRAKEIHNFFLLTATRLFSLTIQVQLLISSY